MTPVEIDEKIADAERLRAMADRIVDDITGSRVPAMGLDLTDVGDLRRIADKLEQMEICISPRNCLELPQYKVQCEL
jgi:hypothetical protein